MSFCRTCKYWSVRPDMIGAGFCTNINTQLRLLVPDGLMTAQNFGCVLHEAGYQAHELVSRGEQARIAQEFIKDR